MHICIKVVKVHGCLQPLVILKRMSMVESVFPNIHPNTVLEYNFDVHYFGSLLLYTSTHYFTFI